MRHKSNTDRVKKLNYQPLLLKNKNQDFLDVLHAQQF
jgi:hypothetical protein